MVFRLEFVLLLVLTLTLTLAFTFVFTFMRQLVWVTEKPDTSPLKCHRLEAPGWEEFCAQKTHRCPLLPFLYTRW